MAAGRLLWYSVERGYGLLQPDLGGPPQVVTRADLPCPTRRRLDVVRAPAGHVPPAVRAARPVLDQATALVPA